VSPGCVAPNSGFSVVTFNTHLGGVDPGLDSLYPLDAVTARMAADVMVFQEVVQGDDVPTVVVPATARVFANVLDDSYSRTVAGVHRAGSLSTLIVSSLPVLEERTWVLTPYSDRAQARVQLLHLQTDKGRVWFVGVHLSAENVPLLSAVHFNDLSRRVKGLAAQGSPVVVAGDHNLWARVVRLRAPEGARFASNAPTWPARNPRHCIDHVWGVGVDVHGFVAANVGGDHLPVFAHVNALL
jgi:endonuclease/exonuclease/phosphatase family metal-dependent hydrolase